MYRKKHKTAHIKNRTALVIAFSSVIISSVLALTIFGFYAYLGWKEKEIRKNYKVALYDLNAKTFEKYVIVKLDARFDTEGIFKGKPIVRGTIKNTSRKTIYSLRLKLAFYDKEHRTVYVDTFYPVGLELESLVNIADIRKMTKNFLLEGDSISFKHRLKNCPPKVLEYLKSKRKFAGLGVSEPLKLEYKIAGLDIR